MITDFRVDVVNSQGRPIPGAAIRLVCTNPLFDATTGQFGQSPVYANQDGVFRVDYGVPYGGTVKAVYIVYATAPGYQEAQVYTEPDFVGVGHYSLTLTRQAVDASVETLAKTGVFVCPMYPVGIDVDAAAPDAAWEFIETTVQDETNVDSVIENNIVQGKARVNIQSRLRLKPQLNLIGDNTLALTDPDFSATFSVSFASVTNAGTQPIGAGFTYHVANAFPQTDDSNDLTSFTNETGLASWLSPWGVSWGRELPVFEGQYADAMVWLTKPGAGDYGISTQFYDINRVALSKTDTPIPTALFLAKKAVRIRIPDAITGAYYAELVIKRGGVAQTKSLFVRYIRA